MLILIVVRVFSENVNDNKKFYLILFLGFLADRNSYDAGNSIRYTESFAIHIIL